MANSPHEFERDLDHALIWGVCAGISMETDVPLPIVRVCWAMGTLVTGILFGTLAYVLLAYFMPAKHTGV